MTNKEQIIAKALEVLKGAPQGIRYSELVARISTALPQIPKNTIHGTIWNLEVQLPAQVVKPARGLYVGTQYRQPAVVEPDAVPVSPAEKIKEERFYEPFASGEFSEEYDLVIEKAGDVDKVSWITDGKVTAVGAGMETESGLAVGWRRVAD